MSVLSSPSPTLSPNPAGVAASAYAHAHPHDRPSYASSLRRSGSHRSYRLSPSSSQAFLSHASSPATSVHSSSTLQHTPTFAPKRRAIDVDDDPRCVVRATSVDVGTQYSPPDFPPTAKRSMTSTSTSTSTSTTVSQANTTTADGTSEFMGDLEQTTTRTPPEPSLRQDPQPHTPTGTSSDSVPVSTVSETSSLLDSPSKRARGDTSVKVMPLDYMKADVRDLGVVIADMLMELIRINDPLPVRNEQLTRYHSRAPPMISVHDYLSRLIIHATLSPPILLSLVYYIDKLSALYPVFNISSLTVHRYLITVATVAAKGLSDSFWTNSTYAKVGGISVRELGLLELDFLEKMDWKIIPPADILVDYYRNLVERNDNYELEQEHPSSDSQTNR